MKSKCCLIHFQEKKHENLENHKKGLGQDNGNLYSCKGFHGKEWEPITWLKI